MDDEPRYLICGDAITHIRELAELGTEVVDCVFSEIVEVAKKPEKIGAPLDRATLEAMEDQFSASEFRRLIGTRVFYGKACPIKWFVASSTTFGKYPAVYYLKPYPRSGANPQGVPSKKEDKSIIQIIMGWFGG